MARRAEWLAVAAALGAAPTALAQPVTLPLPGTEAGIVVKPGPQREPALSSPFGSFVAYTDYAPSPSQVWFCRLEGLVCPAFQVPASPGNQFQPAVAGDVLVYVDEGQFGSRRGNVFRMSITQGFAAPVSPFDAFQGAPAVSDRLIAWEDDRNAAATGRDVWVHDLLLGGEWSITGAGNQHVPRASGTLVSYLDDASGTVKVYDLASGLTTVAYPAPALFADVDGTSVVVQTVAGDLEVRSSTGVALASLVLPGLQSNPHISGDWVAFEDNSTSVSRVIVWNWRTGLLYAPPAGTSSQTLNDIAWPRVVYVDDRSPVTGQDIFLYDTSVGESDGGTDGGTGVPARCDDALAVPEAELTVVRQASGPDADNVEFTQEKEVPVLVCLDSDDVSAAWVLLDDEAVARPDDFNQQVVHLERRRSVAAGMNRLGALVAGKPGSRLTVRLIPDPGGGPAPVAGAGLKVPGLGASGAPPPGQGCSGGAAGLGALLSLGVWLVDRRRRRA